MNMFDRRPSAIAIHVSSIGRIFANCCLAIVVVGCFAQGGNELSAGERTEAYAPLRLGEVQPRGWLKSVLQRDLATGYAGHLDELLENPVTKKKLLLPENNDYVTRTNNKDCRHDKAGLTIPPGRHSWWDAEMIGDWHDSLIRAAYLTGDKAARAKADRFVEAILDSQDADGYIGIYPKGYRFHFSGPDAELWTQRCVLLPLLAYYEFTGKQEVLDAIERSVKLTISQYGSSAQNYFDNPGQIGSGVSHGLMYLDVLEWMFRLTGDSAYREAAISFYNNYNAAERIHDKDAQLVRLLDPDVPLSGHGPDVMGFLRVPLLCYYLTGKQDYQTAWQHGFRKTERHLGIGGSPLSGHVEEIAQKGQTPDMPYEYCSTFYLMHSLIWAMQKTGEPCYGDMFERALFNAAQGARFANGKALTYYSADERLWVRQKPPEGRGNHRYIYSAAIYPSCCHDSGARVYPYMISALWMRSHGERGDGLVATLYGPCQVQTKINGVAVTVVEDTRYPFSFEIRLKVTAQRPVDFPIRLRVPAWAHELLLDVGHTNVKRDEHGMLVVRRRWKTGDSIRVVFAPRIQGQNAVDGRTALTYGPLVFSLPIRERAEVVREFPPVGSKQIGGFRAYQYDPVDLKAAKRPLKLHGNPPDFGFRAVIDKDSDPRFPWDRPPITLHGMFVGSTGKPENVVLLPMGSTLLRRTFFPVAERD